jgi:hypothetical protein
VAAPRWPDGAPLPSEAELWKRLWAWPVAAWWHEQGVDPSVIARYVSLRFASPALATLSRLEAELGLTPATMARLRLTVEEPEVEAVAAPDPYAHLKAELE